ncbi:uncharacterized protein LOC144686212 [Cetorhinus maximus]
MQPVSNQHMCRRPEVRQVLEFPDSELRIKKDTALLRKSALQSSDKMAVAFPDGRSILLVSWKEKVPVEELQRILCVHFKDLAHRFQADCVVQKLDSQEVLVTLTRITKEVLSSIAENATVAYKDEEIKLDIKIPVDDFFTVHPTNLAEETMEAFESDDRHEIVFDIY